MKIRICNLELQGISLQYHYSPSRRWRHLEYLSQKDQRELGPQHFGVVQLSPLGSKHYGPLCIPLLKPTVLKCSWG